MRIFKIYFLRDIQICNIVLLIQSHHTVSCILMTYFRTRILYLLAHFTHFTHLLATTTSANHQSILCIYKLVFFFYFCFVLDSIYKWNHDICLSLSDISPSIMPWRSVHVLSGKILFSISISAVSTSKVQSTTDWKYVGKKIPESSKRHNLKLPYSETIYTAFTLY